MNNEAREAKLKSAGEIYIIRYRNGEESRVVEAAMKIAINNRYKFDLYDATAICYLLGRDLFKELSDKFIEE